MTGPQFLALYWSALGLTIAVGIALIIWVRRSPSGPPLDLDLYGVALLSGGWKRVGDTALAGLASRGQVRVSRSSGYTPVATARPADGFEDAVLQELRGRRRTTYPAMATSPAALDLHRRMADAGLVHRPERARRGKKLGWVFFLILVAGVVRLITGIANDRPVGYLVGSLVATLVAWFIIVPWIASAGRTPKPTPRGRESLAHVRARGGHRAGMAVGAAVLLPVAFTGLVAYPDPEMSQAFAEHERATSSSSSGDSGSGGSGGDSGGGSSCGGGGGGCGGCGGGG
ncbi:TIGR04222 domain-containing membrane protein [Actinokineospora guangxiensis]|uniref:TIGR04222 domain-containing membrane protein n=1 Tax=Actinokineospora guangxiensis TaxID=1490288 RepID=A0ABW0EMZ7_9PSEU